MRATCRIAGCEKESRGRGLCGTHWLRWKEHGDPSVVKRSGVDYNRSKVCSVDSCDRRAHAHGFCQMHLRRYEKHGDPTAVVTASGRPLKGAIPTFGAVHRRLSRARGSASTYLCVDCGKSAREWSYNNADLEQVFQLIGDSRVAYSLDISNYDPRCTSCHRRFDRAFRLANPLQKATSR